MKKILAAASLALLSAVMTVPAGAETYGGSFGNPGENGSCNPVYYYEVWGNEWYTWEIPVLEDGQSIEVGADKAWSDYWGYYYLESDQYNSPKNTFTCNNGTVSGSVSGYWFAG
jgi:hypothetical protein